MGLHAAENEKERNPDSGRDLSVKSQTKDRIRTAGKRIFAEPFPWEDRDGRS